MNRELIGLDILAEKEKKDTSYLKEFKGSTR